MNHLVPIKFQVIPDPNWKKLWAWRDDRPGTRGQIHGGFRTGPEATRAARRATKDK